ncbi:MAG: LysR family transcriptional regulator, partial [Actinomycetota bacterium]|nr:LysR family transcriptional regulator [Actinomycetota bacterium]
MVGIPPGRGLRTVAAQALCHDAHPAERVRLGRTARLGSLTAAANALGVRESAVSQARSALRLHLGDQLVIRGPAGMTLKTS